jgi:hypothetical protein
MINDYLDIISNVELKNLFTRASALIVGLYGWSYLQRSGMDEWVTSAPGQTRTN